MPDYFTLAELRALPDMGNPSKFSADAVEAAAARITSIIEREVGTSFVTRLVLDEVHDGGRDHVVLDSPWVQTALSATENGTAVAETLNVRHGILRKLSGSCPTRWADGYGNVSVSYESGYSVAPPADIKDAALQGTRLFLLASASDSSANARRTSLSTDVGVESYVIAGEDRPTGYPEVDATILGWKAKLRAPSVA
jgi:hypothetical protein